MGSVQKRKTLPLKIGLVGGGQLARMMALEAHRMGFEPHIFSSSLADPAAQVTQFHHIGLLSDFKSLQEFAQKMDYLTFESEFVPPEVLLELENAVDSEIFPRPQLMRLFQNRLSQKQTLLQHKVPTAPFVEFENLKDLKSLWETFQGPFVLKSNFGGYDGNGTFFAQNEKRLKDLSDKLPASPQGFMAEQMIPFKRELASILIRSSSGETLALPLVETSQLEGRCNWVRGPLKHSKWPDLQKRLFQMMKSLNYVGALGVEMFDTGAQLMVNELAPRVHNSGHYSQAALNENQFALHLKAGLGLKLGPLQVLSPQFVMANLLGESENDLQVPTDFSGQLHLYGKAQNRPGRKMGHLNFLGPKGPALLSKALKERKGFRL